MIITDDFVYIHFPKTGGTFVTHVLERLYKYKKNYRSVCNFLPERIQRKALRYRQVRDKIQGFIQINKHGTCNEIPKAHRHKPILGTVRNPYDRLVSHYEFAWWKVRPEEEFFPYTVPQIQKYYPHFPALSFEEYLNLWNTIWLPTEFMNGRLDDGASLGIETYCFVDLYFRQSREGFSNIAKKCDRYVATQQYKTHMFPVHLLRTDRLNQDLYDFLLQLGWEKDELAFILDLEKILPEGAGRSQEQAWEKYYTPALKSEIREKERFIFDMFPEFDV